MGSDSIILDYLIDQLSAAYGDLKVKSGTHLAYLNMMLDTSDATKLVLNMCQYKRELIDGMSLTPHSSPGGVDFADSPDSPLLNASEKASFHTFVAKLLYLANTAHAELNYYVNILCQRVHSPTHADLKKLYRVLGYVAKTVDAVLTLDATSFHHPKVYIDASYATNPDAKSQTGCCIFFGRGSIMCSSTKQSIVTKSSSESELVGLSDKCSEVIGFIHFLEAFDIHMSTITIYQDNKSTIRMIHNGKPTGKLARHINIRYFWLKQLIQSGQYRLEYMPTGDMVADVFTKSLDAPTFRRLADLVLGVTSNHFQSSFSLRANDEGLCSNSLTHHK
jgi:hypothetical protein